MKWVRFLAATAIISAQLNGGDAWSAESGRTITILSGGHDLMIFGDFNSEVRRASIIARVHLTSRTQVALRPEFGKDPIPALGEEPACGFLYHAQVVDSLKGKERSFDFFASEDADFTGMNHDYLVYVYERQVKLLTMRDTELTLPMADVRRTNCLLSQRYYVGTVLQTMFSFSADGTQVLPPTRDVPGSCGGHAEKTPHDWATFRDTIVEALRPDGRTFC